MPSSDATCYRQGETGDDPVLVMRIEDLQFLASNHIGRFHRLAYRYLGNKLDAEEAVQDAFLSAYRHLSDFKGQARLSTWFTIVVINSARMHLRRRRHSPIYIHQQLPNDPAATTHLEALPAPRPDPEQVCGTAELTSILRLAIHQLAPRLRRVAHICLLDGLNAAEAAEVLGIPSGTVKTQLSRARAQITRRVRKAMKLQFVKPR